MMRSIVLCVLVCGAIMAEEICTTENAGNTTPTGSHSRSIPLDVVYLSPSQIQSQIRVADVCLLGSHKIGVKAVFCDDPYGSAVIDGALSVVTVTRDSSKPHTNHGRLYITVYCDALYWTTSKPPPHMVSYHYPQTPTLY